jgi:hypothetical protein
LQACRQVYSGHSSRVFPEGKHVLISIILGVNLRDRKRGDGEVRSRRRGEKGEREREREKLLLT